MEPRDVRAAGAVVTRAGGEVLLVHRPKYDDWSFPKGKLDRGEHAVAAAVREVAEETGLGVRLGPALTRQRYRMSNGRWKSVDYWTARVVGADDVAGYRPNAEIDAVEWLPWRDAERRLTYAYDRDTLAEARPLRRRTRALVVLRHAEARARGSWRKDDRLRPLVRRGEAQAQRLVPLLAAFHVTVAHTSSSTRCVQTVTPWADATCWPTELHDELSEEDATVDSVVDLVDDLRDVLAEPEDDDLDPAAHGSIVLCTHRPVLPTVLDALGAPAVTLEPGSMLVVHHRKGSIVATQLVAP